MFCITDVVLIGLAACIFGVILGGLLENIHFVLRVRHLERKIMERMEKGRQTAVDAAEEEIDEKDAQHRQRWERVLRMQDKCQKGLVHEFDHLLQMGQDYIKEHKGDAEAVAAALTMMRKELRTRFPEQSPP